MNYKKGLSDYREILFFWKELILLKMLILYELIILVRILNCELIEWNGFEVYMG